MLYWSKCSCTWKIFIDEDQDQVLYNYYKQYTCNPKQFLMIFMSHAVCNRSITPGTLFLQHVWKICINSYNWLHVRGNHLPSQKISPLFSVSRKYSRFDNKKSPLSQELASNHSGEVPLHPDLLTLQSLYKSLIPCHCPYKLPLRLHHLSFKAFIY